MNKTKIRKITTLAMLSAIAYAVMYISHILPPMIGFLRYDPKDVIIAFGGFAYGPIAVIMISVLVSFIEMISISNTGGWGFLMNIISTLAFTLPIIMIYRKKRTMKGAAFALIIGTLAVTAVMIFWNIIVTPIYMGQPREAIIDMLLPIFLPFNLIKGIINSALLLLLYRPLMPMLKRFCFFEAQAVQQTNNKKISWSIIFIAVFLILLSVLAVILIR